MAARWGYDQWTELQAAQGTFGRASATYGFCPVTRVKKTHTCPEVPVG